MKLYMSGRQSGKTTKLILESARTGAVIVTGTRAMCEHIKSTALDYGLTIPVPITFGSFVYTMSSVDRNIKKKYLIDELQMMLFELGVNAATINTDCIEFVYLDRNEIDLSAVSHIRDVLMKADAITWDPILETAGDFNISTGSRVSVDFNKLATAVYNAGYRKEKE